MIVRLTTAERQRAENVAILRQQEAQRLGCRNRHGKPDNAAQELKDHVMGACGELAVAKLLNVPWSASVNTFRRGPEESNPNDWLLQVRTRKCWKPQFEELPIRMDDRDIDVFVLTVCNECDFDVKGWILPITARQPGFWRDPGNRGAPGWFIPHSALAPVEDLLLAQTFGIGLRLRV